jgi:hypothetical protein
MSECCFPNREYFLLKDKFPFRHFKTIIVFLIFIFKWQIKKLKKCDVKCGLLFI